jgi:hypothetical protein
MHLDGGGRGHLILLPVIARATDVVSGGEESLWHQSGDQVAQGSVEAVAVAAF